jgi:flagellar basal-body rod protein FlgG
VSLHAAYDTEGHSETIGSRYPSGEDGRGLSAQGFVEDSNVSVVEEMVNMILGQRAYEANSRVIKAADEMLSQVNAIVR